MTLFEELKAATKSAHDQLESQLNLLSPEIQISDYRNVLEKFLGLYIPLENAVKNSEIAKDFHDRWKVHLLKQDLKNLGMSDLEIENIPQLNLFGSEPSLEELIGALYVMEGSTLGAMILSKHFHLRFHLDSFNGLAYFSGYGANTPLKWREWREYSERLTQEMSLSRKSILNQANKTFTTLGKWMS